MTKAKLLKKLDEAIIIEEQAVPVYSDHLKVIFKWSKLSKENKKRINEIFNILIKESKKHITMFKYIKKQLI